MFSRLPYIIFMGARFLREGRTQTILIFTAMTVGVGTAIFLTALITGLQKDLLDKTLGSQAHIILESPDKVLVPPQKEHVQVLSLIQKPPEQLRRIAQWQRVIRSIRRVAVIQHAAPVASGPAVVTRAAAVRNVLLKGVDFSSWNRLYNLELKIVQGKSIATGRGALLGVALAERLGMKLGDRFRIDTSLGRGDTMTLDGVFDFKNADLNERMVLTALPTAQTLLDLPGSASAIEVTIPRVFEAENIAQRLASHTGLKARSWMSANAQLLSGLRAQSSSSMMIQFFVGIAVALGIASVLAVAVVQKSKEIGILRATGTSTRQILGIFLFQGAAVGFGGAVFGSALGAGLAFLFQKTALNPDGTPRFPLDLSPTMFAIAFFVAVLVGLAAAIVPARRAARLDPALVIRNG